MLPQRKHSLTYRPDVDGLRAVAVLLVVFYHLLTRFATGGYVGVDVFFVISGYLISSVILSEMAAGKFSVVNFYERRIRRIFPALFAMLLGSAALTYFYFVPSETEAFAKSLLAALFSVSNFLFWRQAGYFDTPSALKPLLHTWSLAVEEQFYIFFPLFLIAVRRWFPDRLRAAIWSIAILTFALASITVPRDPAAAFYFAPLRAWELLIGTIVSQHYVPAIAGKMQRNAAAIGGLVLILAPAFLYTSKTPFPGIAALPPCLGAALIIAAGETGPSVVGRLLALRPVVFIGLISYSLYLWHWPILVFVERNYILSSAKELNRASVFVASFIAATLSWLFVETPFRTGRFRPSRRALFAVAGVAVLLIAAVGASMIATQGFPSRFPSEALAIDRYTDFDPGVAFRKNECFIDPITTIGGATFENFNKAVCLAEDPGRKQYLLIGDSHAADLYPGLRNVFPELNISQATAPGCGPFLSQPVDRENAYCIKIYQYIFDDYLSHHHVDAVLISVRWLEAYFPGLGNTVAWLQQHGIRVILFGPGIEFDVPLPRLLTLSLLHGNPSMLDGHRKTEPLQTDEKLAEIARNQWKVDYISIYENLCIPKMETSGCPVYAAPGVPLLFDTNHLTPLGSELFAKTMRDRHQLP
jgi:peptidoglycan/LPS O-acetylase OafA/YrhL